MGARILLTSPFAHPYVRRGVERYVGELASWLAGRGHDVTLLTTAPDRTRTERRGGVTVQYRRAGRPIGRGRLRVDELLRTTPAIARGAVARRGHDVVEAHHYPDAAALRSTGRRPYVFWLPGVPRSAAFTGRPLNRAAAGYALRGAAGRLTLSRHAADALRREFALSSEVLPPGVDTRRYAGPRPAPRDEVVLCAAAADDPRKRVGDLVRAFAEVVRRRPGVRLVLAPPAAGPAAALLVGLDRTVRDRIDIRVPAGSDELAALYRSATASVLPSVDEAFGLVLVESLAAGTPVVGVRSGAVPEVVDDDAVGRLAEPGEPIALARAIVEALDLGADAGTADACRRAARRWDWDTVGPRWEAIHGIGP